MKTLLSLTCLLLLFSSITSAAQTESANDISELDQLKISVQKICPVSGQKLGSMGKPIKVKIGDQSAFLCCKGCQGKEVNTTHWATIQDRLAKAQGTCPIMGNAVDSTMKSTVVDGHPIFVCCPPCIPKIEADPKASLKILKDAYAKSVKAEVQAASDQFHIKAQGICPVTGQKLGSMGTPVKVKVGKEEHAFLCCKGCVGKKIKVEHWKTIQSNLAKAQGICPVMEEPVDSTMESVVVNGRKIFVCCPPCIKKIKEDPAKYVAMLNAQIAKNGKSESKDKSQN